ncbi:MAG: signal peptidase I [Armatimonadota bacterium]
MSRERGGRVAGWWEACRAKARPSWRRLAAILGLGACVVGGAASLPWRLGVVVGESMAPTLAPGSIFVYERISPREPVSAGEIVVAWVHGAPSVKRVYATGGSAFWALRQTVESGQRRDPIDARDRARFERIAAQRRARFGQDLRIQNYQIPEGFVFLVGDGTTSDDSRSYGVIPADRILGRLRELPGQSFAATSPPITIGFPTHSAAVRQPRGSAGEG